MSNAVDNGMICFNKTWLPIDRCLAIQGDDQYTIWALFERDNETEFIELVKTDDQTEFEEKLEAYGERLGQRRKEWKEYQKK